MLGGVGGGEKIPRLPDLSGFSFGAFYKFSILLECLSRRRTEWVLLPELRINEAQGFGVFRAGEHPLRGFRPVAVFADRFLALVAAAVLPGTGRDLLLTLARDEEPDGQGYAVRLDDGTVVGYCPQFQEELVASMNTVVGIVRGPGSIAYGMEAAGAIALERAGAIFAARIAAAAAEGGP